VTRTIGRTLTSFLFALACSCHPACDDPRLNDDVPESKLPPPPHLHRTPIPSLLHSDTFPPLWKVGQTWLVKSRPREQYRSNKSVYDTGEEQTSIFSFLVTGVDRNEASIDSQPSDVYAHVPLDTQNTERQIFNLRPFGLRETWQVNGWGRAVERSFIGDGGPCCESCRCGIPVPSEKLLADGIGRLETQASEPIENGIRFYLGADMEHPTVIEWMKGEPWWSRLYILDSPAPSLPQLGTDWARLVRADDGTPISPAPPASPKTAEPDGGPTGVHQ
jgi:hypothetical protein